MKLILFTSYLVLLSCFVNGQSIPLESESTINNYQLAGDNSEELKIVYVHKDVSTLFVAMEDVKFVDISIADIAGDIPTNNTLRVKPKKEGASGVLTIMTERYLVQYMLVYTSDMSKAYTRLNIPYSDLRSYLNPESSLTRAQMYNYAHNMFIADKSFYNVSTKTNLLSLTLNNIYTIDKYFFLDVTIFNKSNIQYDIDQIRFKIEDKDQLKATNFQSVEILPLMKFNNDLSFKKKYKNVFVFEKFTFPEEKVLTIEFSEEQISGRTIILRVDYTDILSADNFIN